MLTVTYVVSRDRQLRSARVLCFVLTSLGPLMASAAEELKYSKVVEWFARRCRPVSVDFMRLSMTLNEWSNVET